MIKPRHKKNNDLSLFYQHNNASMISSRSISLYKKQIYLILKKTHNLYFSWKKNAWCTVKIIIINIKQHNQIYNH